MLVIGIPHTSYVNVTSPVSRESIRLATAVSKGVERTLVVYLSPLNEGDSIEISRVQCHSVRLIGHGTNDDAIQVATLEVPNGQYRIAGATKSPNGLMQSLRFEVPFDGIVVGSPFPHEPFEIHESPRQGRSSEIAIRFYQLRKGDKFEVRRKQGRVLRVWGNRSPDGTQQRVGFEIPDDVMVTRTNMINKTKTRTTRTGTRVVES